MMSTPLRLSVAALCLLAALAPVINADSGSSILDQANRRMLTGSYADAERLYRRVVADETNPDRELAMLLLGRCLEQGDKWDEAESLLRQLVIEYPRGSYADDALLYMGRHYARSPQRKDLIQALKLFLIIPRRYPDEDSVDEALAAAGESLSLVGEYQRAEGLLKRVSDNAPRDLRARALFARAQNYSNPANPHRDFGKAKELYQRLLDEHPQFEHLPAALFALGSCNRGLHEWDAALSNFQQLVSRYPDDYFAPFARSYVSLIQRERREQELSLKKFLDALRNPASVQATGSGKGDAKILVDLLKGQKDQLAIEADVMDFKREANVAKYKGNVMIHGNGWEVRADTVEVDLNRKTLEGYGNVQVLKGEETTLDGDRFSWDLTARRAVASGDVVLRRLTPQGEMVTRQDKMIISLEAPAESFVSSETTPAE